MLCLVESEPRTVDGWTKVEWKTKRSKSTNWSLDSRKPYTNELQSKSVRFDDTETHKKMHIGDNGVSNCGMIVRDKKITWPEKWWKSIILINCLKPDLRDKISVRNYCTGFVAVLAQLYFGEIVDSTMRRSWMCNLLPTSDDYKTLQVMSTRSNTRGNKI